MGPIVSDSSDTAATERSSSLRSEVNEGRHGRKEMPQRQEKREQEHRHASKRRRVAKGMGLLGDRAERTTVETLRDETPWTAADHRAFATAIYTIGLQNSSPTVLRDKMSTSIPQEVTLERIKSHLQKYRAKASKREEEFLLSYDEWMSNAMSSVESPKQRGEQQARAPLPALLGDTTKPGTLSSGAVAAHLGFSVMMEERAVPCQDDAIAPLDSLADTNVRTYLDANEHVIRFPSLSDQEKQSSLGSSLCLVMGLFFSMREQVAEARRRSAAGLGGGSNSIQNRNVETNPSPSLPTPASRYAHEVLNSQSKPAAVTTGAVRPLSSNHLAMSNFDRRPPLQYDGRFARYSKSQPNHSLVPAGQSSSMQSSPSHNSTAAAAAARSHLQMSMSFDHDSSSSAVNYNYSAFRPPRVQQQQQPQGQQQQNATTSYGTEIGGSNVQSGQDLWEEEEEEDVDDDDYSSIFFRDGHAS